MAGSYSTKGLSIMTAFLVSAFISLGLATEEETLGGYREAVECDHERVSLPPCKGQDGDMVTAGISDVAGKIGEAAKGTEGQGQGSASSGNAKTGQKDPYDRQGRYWLVPPFLIGASSVIVLYIFVHCMYLHCYAKKRMRKLEEHSKKTAPKGPTLLSEAPPDSGSVHPVTPMVKYDGAYGKTEVVEAQPFLVCQPLESGDDSTAGRNVQLQLPKLFAEGRCESSLSVVSTSSVEVSAAGTDHGNRSQQTRASICFVPVGRSVSDQSGSGQAEWTPLQGFMYSSFILSRKPSYNQAVINGPVGSEAQLLHSSAVNLNLQPYTDDEDQSPPVIIVPADGAQPFQGIATGPTFPNTTCGQEESGGITISVSSPDNDDTQDV